jgi:DNA-binding winged helix-turn-helix (wHTH) protein
MEQEHSLAFGPFRFDIMQGCVWHGDQAIALRPQSLALLRYLVGSPPAGSPCG